MFPCRNIHKYTWTSPDRKTYNQTDHVLIDKKWNSNIVDIRFFSGVDCNTGHYPVVAKVRQRLSVSKQAL
jgi:hypothetical protein